VLDDFALRHHLAMRGGVATRDELVELLGRSGLEDAVSREVVRRVAAGRYCLPTMDDALRASVELSAVLSHRSAALLHGWSLAQEPERPELVVPRTRKVAPGRRDEVTLRWRDLAPDEIRVSEHARATAPLRTVIDCARDLPWSEALAVADSALREKHVSPRELRAAADAVRTTGRDQARRVAAEADARAANAFESVLRSIALDVAGLSLQPQYVVEERGFRGRPDLVDTALRLVVEAESWEFHGHRKALHNDCGRYNALVLRGWTVLRFSWEHVMLDPDYVRAALRAAVSVHAGHAALPPELDWPRR
jgi:very-short-patch-repair endonuclease